ncbi:hypothetical protein HDU76_006581 [Blyttiomyces sp. JEL0837]|nr:hypothetical protein HDU76_006581 [Blyttiomyces sp. JEL0837]
MFANTDSNYLQVAYDCSANCAAHYQSFISSYQASNPSINIMTYAEERISDAFYTFQLYNFNTQPDLFTVLPSAAKQQFMLEKGLSV